MSLTIGLGCMRLSTLADRDDARAVATIHAALDAGAMMLDTADSYCHDDRDFGHNERLIANALRTWGGDRSTIEVATKGGLRRPGGKWVPDGKGKSIRAACEASLRALDVDVIDLYQLHAVDPRTPLETSVRALAALKDEGKIRRVGLCNVTVGQIASARRIVEVASVQVSLSPFDDESLRNGVAEYCRDHGIRLIAYRPLGGERVSRLSKDADLVEVAVRYGASPQEIVLAWLMGLTGNLTPVPGATRVETAHSMARALRVELTDDDRRILDAKYSGRLLRVPRASRRPPNDADGDVVLVMGMPGAGKSTTAHELEAQGYERLNRDLRGGSLTDLIPHLGAGLAAGRRRWVLDNTYPSRYSRNEVIECAWTYGVPARCIWVATNVADAQINAISRMIALHGSLPSPEALREHGKDDPRFFGPEAQFRYERTVEPPSAEEGFVVVEERGFVRLAADDGTARSVVLDYDDLVAFPALVTAARRHAENGWLLFAHAWRPDIARGTLTLEAAREDFARTRATLGADIAIACCPHDAGPPICWCRKPLPGSLLEFALGRGVALGQSIVVSRSAADRTMAQRLGMTYVETEAFLSFRAEPRSGGVEE